MKEVKDLDKVLKAAKEPLDTTMTMEFEDGSRQLLHPSKAFDGNWKALCLAVAEGRPFKVYENHTKK